MTAIQALVRFRRYVGAMVRALAAFVLCLPMACGGIAWNTTIADNAAVRRQMAASVVPGRTTETELITRWGRPTQKIREGGQVEYIYRNVLNAHPQWLPQFGDSTRYVIVTFRYGIATAVRTNEDEPCRATFPPRPPGAAWDNPTIVEPVETCPGLYRPQVGGPIPVAGGVPPGTDPVLDEDAVPAGGQQK